MRCLHVSRGLVLSAAITFLAACSLAGCSSSTKAEAGAVGTAGAGSAIGVAFTPSYLTIENHSGVPLVEGEVTIVPSGLMPPFHAPLPRVESNGKQDMLFNAFRGSDGTSFRRGVIRARRVRITATDFNGKKYQQEVPFN